ncbi:hypothetical protein TVAG_095300 [Trichomonas vaginalis G3]|uniref:Uncharacterized protein n=1 Tax=Trichomonas vaginalis (strain ATCC PRA-98 / G3) TaxID=412133 RepID=A2GDP6_TRIV3|nr:hypothetical protein TVAG_095300 [Trichomonas vaginalis G3]|eukprot:XP_001297652.1 hypothetical protein [Trichomonas vaginalis G3]
MSVYLVSFWYVSFHHSLMYKTTSQSSKISTHVLAIYIAVGPFILIPISVQYFGQIISSLIVGRTKDVVSIVSSIIGILIVIPYLWIMVKAYLITLTFRPCSFMSIEASPQWKFFFTTLIVTFVSSLTTYFQKWPSLAMICISAAGYVYCGTTCFNGGNFVLELHQVMVLGGSFLGFILCCMNLYALLSLKRWNEIFFEIFIAIAVACFLLTQVYVRLRYKRDLVILDKSEESQDITLFVSKGKFRRVVGTGYTFCHPACINFSVFKAAIVEWPESIDLWAEYAKFVAIYPELTPTLIYIGQSINALNLKDSISTIIMSNIGYIMNTRETKITPALTSKISKLNKIFNKAKNRIRNIWDLILQGSVAEINHAIKSANEAVELADVEVSQLKSLYLNNRFVARQYAKFQGDINANAVEYKVWMENVIQLQAGKQVCADIVHGLGVFVFPSLPESVEGSDGKNMMSLTEMESVEELNDEQQAEEDANIEVLATLTRQIEKQRIPAIKCMYMSTCLGWFFTVFVPILALIIYYTTFREDLNAPLVFMYGISYMRNLLNMLAAFTAKFLFEELPDPKSPEEKVTDVIHLQEGFPLTGFGDDVRSREILKYLAAQVSSTSSMMSSLRSYKFGNELLEKARDMVFGSTIVFNFYTNRSMEYPMKSSVAQIAALIATHIGSLITDDEITYDDARGSDYLTATNNNDLATEQMSSALLVCLEYILKQD